MGPAMVCPNCRNRTAIPHCPRGCGWFFCPACRHYGKVDGSRIAAKK